MNQDNHLNINAGGGHGGKGGQGPNGGRGGNGGAGGFVYINKVSQTFTSELIENLIIQVNNSTISDEKKESIIKKFTEGLSTATDAATLAVLISKAYLEGYIS
jgi:transcriptional regulator CtsR